ncbi:MAG: hypothetical protein P8L85_05035 [Rubripirellula sp.]|nr:hypothetical protein [Rubripirellula sp.]
MSDSYKTQLTEKINNEDWCTHCKKTVDEWNISFEYTVHSDTGYDKIRRCPHCNAMCFEDGSIGFGVFLFFLGLFGIPCLVLVGLVKFGIKLDRQIEGHDGIIFVVTVAAALLFSIVVPGLYKRFLYRHKPANDKLSE